MKLARDLSHNSSAPIYKFVNDDDSDLTPEQQAELNEMLNKGSETFSENQDQ